jgi:hypothetical protein
VPGQHEDINELSLEPADVLLDPLLDGLEREPAAILLGRDHVDGLMAPRDESAQSTVRFVTPGIYANRTEDMFAHVKDGRPA